MFTEFAKSVIEWAEGEGYDVRRDYSGRGMYGKRCLGVVVPDTSKLADLYYQLGHSAGSEGIEIEMPRGFQQDNMGHDMIIYWPRVQVEEVEMAEDE